MYRMFPTVASGPPLHANETGEPLFLSPYCSGAIPILKMIIFCLFTIFAKRDWLFRPAWAGGVKNHIFGAFTLKVDIKQIFFKSNLFKSSTA